MSQPSNVGRRARWLWALARRVRVTFCTVGVPEIHWGVGYHSRNSTPGPDVGWKGERGLLFLDIWLAHDEWQEERGEGVFDRCTSDCPVCRTRRWLGLPVRGYSDPSGQKNEPEVTP